MVGRYLDDDPAYALEHARYAVSRAGRVAAVREAAAVAAYVNEEFHEALKEFRTYRRITGDDAHLALMVDCERALGRPDKALELATSEAVSELPSAAKVELAIVVAGMRRDEGDAEGALKALEIPQLQRNRGFSYSPRLFRAYAEALRGVGRGAEAGPWDRQAVIAEAALGTGQFEDPEIVDLVGEDEEPDAGMELDSADAMQDDVDRVSDVGSREEAPSEDGAEDEADDAPTEATAGADGLVVGPDAGDSADGTAPEADLEEDPYEAAARAEETEHAGTADAQTRADGALDVDAEFDAEFDVEDVEGHDSEDRDPEDEEAPDEDSSEDHRGGSRDD